MIDLLLLQQNLSKELNLQQLDLSQVTEALELGDLESFKTLLSQQLSKELDISPEEALENIAAKILPAEEIDPEIVAPQVQFTPVTEEKPVSPLFGDLVADTDKDLNLQVKKLLAEEEAAQSVKLVQSDEPQDESLLRQETVVNHLLAKKDLEKETTIEDTDAPVEAVSVAAGAILSEDADQKAAAVAANTTKQPLVAVNEGSDEQQRLVRESILPDQHKQTKAMQGAQPLVDEDVDSQTKGKIDLRDLDMLQAKKDVNFEKKVSLKEFQLKTGLDPVKTDHNAVRMTPDQAFVESLKQTQQKDRCGQLVEIGAQMQSTLSTRETMTSTQINQAAKQFNIPQSVYDADWQPQLGQKLMMMAQGGVKKAVIELNPAELGPLNIKLQMDKEKVQVMFNSTHPMTKEVLETAVSRLKEMFDAQGLDLVQVDVNLAEEQQPEGYQDQGSSSHHGQMAAQHGYGGVSQDSMEGAGLPQRKVVGLVDFYA